MHEMALTRSVVSIVEEAARGAEAARVIRVRLEVGALSHAEPEAIRFCYEVCARGTLAEGAVLEIPRPPGRAWCWDCSADVAVPDRLAGCPRCGGHRLAVTGGEELRVKDLEGA